MIRNVTRVVPAIALLAGLVLLTGACGMFYDNSRSDTAPHAQPARAQPGQPAPRNSFVAVPAPGTPSIPVPANGIHRVVRGNTVYSISRLYGVPVRSVIENNRLKPPYLLSVGQKLKLPGRRGHSVAKGETVYSISRRYGVPINELTRANGIAPPYVIVVGQELAIPGSSGGRTATATATTATPPPAPAGKVEVKELPAPPPKPVVAPTRKQIEALPKPPARAASTFLWPLRGKLVSRFGTRTDGRHNDGINIKAKRGATVKAAENGVVAYAGNELRGFGNLLLIKHADGYMTAYAHNDTLLVGRGAKVKRGQPIARVGSTGSVGSSQLHFEIRKGRKAVDPLRFLPRQSAGG